MKTVKSILFYFGLTLALAGYVNYEFSDILLSANFNVETLDHESESESRESEERTYAEEHPTTDSPELEGFSSSIQKQDYFHTLFKLNDFASIVWTPPKLF